MKTITVTQIKEGLEKWRKAKKREVSLEHSAQVKARKNKDRKIDNAYYRYLLQLENDPEEAAIYLGTHHELEPFIPLSRFEEYSLEATYGSTKYALIGILKDFRRKKRLFTLHNIISQNPALKYENIRPHIRSLLKDEVLYIHTQGRGQGKKTIYGFTRDLLYELENENKTAEDRQREERQREVRAIKNKHFAREARVRANNTNGAKWQEQSQNE